MLAHKSRGLLDDNWRAYLRRGYQNCVLDLPGLHDDVVDRSGNGNNGVIYGATWRRLKNSLWYLDFDGTDDQVDCGNNNVLNFTSQNFTVKFWIKFNSLATEQYLFCRGSYNTDGWFIRHHNTVGLIIDTAQSGASQESYQNAVTLSAGIWYHIAFVRNGASCSIYSNGSALSIVAGTHINPASSAQTLKIGTSASSSSFFGGSICLESILSTTWSTSEIQSNYNQEWHLFRV